MHGDAMLVSELDLQFIDNVIAYAGPCEATVRVETNATATTLSLSDTGAGIPAANVPDLLQRFHRVRSTVRALALGSRS